MAITDTVTLQNASWREATRPHDAEVDLPHVFLAALALGGPGAEILAREGVTLAAARRALKQERAARLRDAGLRPDVAESGPASRPNAELHRHAAGHVPATERAASVMEEHPDLGGMRLLRALVTDPTSEVQAMLTRCGLAPARARELLHSTGGPVPSPRRDTFPAPVAIGGAPLPGVSYSFFVSAPAVTVVTAATDPEKVTQWLPLGEVGHMEVTDQGVVSSVNRRTVTAQVHRGDDGRTVVWNESWDGRPGGWISLHAEDCPGGSRVTLSRTLRTSGLLGKLAGALGQRFQTWTVRHAAQNLAFVCADVPGRVE